MPSKPLFVRLAISFVIAVLAARGTYAASDEDAQPADPDSAQALADSLARAAIDSIAAESGRETGRRFSPTYATGYSVNRSITNWQQTLSFNSWIGPLDINSSTSIKIGKDNTLDRDQRDRSTNLGLNYTLLKDIKIGSSIGVVRAQTVDAGITRTSQSTDRFEIRADYSPNLISDFTSAFTASAGTSRDHRDDPLTSSRESTGPHANASANFTLKRGGDWSLRSAVNTSSLHSTEDRTQQTTFGHNQGGNLDFAVDFIIPGFEKWTLTAGRRISQVQYPLVFNEITRDTLGTPVDTLLFTRRETHTTHNRDVSLSATSTPRDNLTLTGTLTYSNSNSDRDIDTDRSQQSINRNADWRMGYTFSDSTHVEVLQKWGVSRALYEDTTRNFLNGDVRSRSLGANAQQPLGRRAGINLAGNYELTSFFFDDLTTNRDDRDLLHGDFTANLDYQPFEKIRSNVRFSFQHNQSIFVDSTKSGTNQTQQSYSVNPALEYRLNSWITFREEGTAIANATVIDFDEDRNRLSRSTELRSIIDTHPMPRLAMNLRHSLRFLEDGSYAPRESGIRVFGKASAETSRDMAFRVDYTVVSGLIAHFRANNRLSDRTTFTLQSGRIFETTSTSEYSEIETGTRVDRTLNLGLQISVDLKRHQTWTHLNARNNYFIGTINLSRRF